MTRNGTAYLLYDDDCGVCSRSAAWLAPRVPPQRLRLVGLAEVDTAPIARLVAGRDLAATLHFITPDGRVRTGARAVLAAGQLVPGCAVFARILDHPLGHTALEPLYRLVARHRRRISRVICSAPSCSLRSHDYAGECALSERPPAPG